MTTAPMISVPSDRAANGAQIRSLIERRIRGIHDKDVATVTSDQAPNIVLFDAIPPLQSIGLDAERERTREWFSSYEGRIGYDVHDLDITAGDDVAFCHYLYRVSGTMKNGQQVDMWVRATLCLRKLDGAWKVTHEHNSVPFDGQSGKAALDLKPQDLTPATGDGQYAS